MEKLLGTALLFTIATVVIEIWIAFRLPALWPKLYPLFSKGAVVLAWLLLSLMDSLSLHYVGAGIPLAISALLFVVAAALYLDIAVRDRAGPDNQGPSNTGSAP